MKKDNFRQFSHWLKSGHLIRQSRIKKYLSTNNPVCLQIGGGRHAIKDWLNGDIIAGDIYLNATKKLPLPDESIDFIFAEQFIEHLSLGDGRKFLNESYRILKKSGVIRISTPDLDLLIQLYYDKNSHISLKDAMLRHKAQHNHELTTPCHFFNDFFRLWDHTFIYEEGTLRDFIRAAGFVNITHCRFGESRHEQLVNRERHADCEWMKYAWTLILEAEKSDRQ